MNTMAVYETVPGFCFHPSDEDLVNHYLHRRIVDGLSLPHCFIKEFDVYSTEPWNLPCDSFRYQDGDKDMYFFTPRHPTSLKSKRANRTAGTGFWDGNGKDQLIKIGSRVIGHKTSLNFKKNQGDEKVKTDWIMHEFRLSRSSSSNAFDDLVLCRIHEKPNKNKNGNGSKRSTEHEEVEQSLLKRRCIEEEEPASLPSPSLSAYSQRLVPTSERVIGCEAPLAVDDLVDDIAIDNMLFSLFEEIAGIIGSDDSSSLSASRCMVPEESVHGCAV